MVNYDLIILSTNNYKLKTLATLVVFLFLVGLQTSCKKNESNDKNKPFIVLNGSPFMNWPLGTEFVDPGAKVFDVTETNDTIDISFRLETSGNVNTEIKGTYELKYSASDEAGNSADEKIRSVKVLITK